MQEQPQAPRMARSFDDAPDLALKVQALEQAVSALAQRIGTLDQGQGGRARETRRETVIQRPDIVWTKVGDTNYTLNRTDDVVSWTAMTAGRSLFLRSAREMAGKIYAIKDESGSATTYDITIDCEGSETIDGAGTLVIDASYGFKLIYSTGAAWFTI